MFLNRAEIAMNRVGGVHENSGLSGAHKRSDYLLRNVSALTYTGNDQSAFAAENSPHYLFKSEVNRLSQLQKCIPF
jgi:hypothetical protein